MRLKWYGHAAFLIQTEGVRVIVDPYRSPDCGGYEPISDPADVVVVSHVNDRYHSHIDQIFPPFQLVRGLEIPPTGTTVHGITFHAIRVYETPERLPDDVVTIIHFRSEALHVVFLGDLGHPLTDDEIAPIRGADVLLVPAGGPPTIALDEIPPLLHAIRPKLVVPMHYKTPKINLNIRPVEDFLARFPGVPVEHPWKSAIEVNACHLPHEMTIVRLEHCR
jgi:L-ascorbate metabolism protein UlaG (beta-lactamase superfamily)